jgi:hypothetical protein
MAATAVTAAAVATATPAAEACLLPHTLDDACRGFTRTNRTSLSAEGIACGRGSEYRLGELLLNHSLVSPGRSQVAQATQDSLFVSVR